MKIEKINENQIRCTLSKEDLEARHIKISELAYGSRKANELFHEMVMQATRDYGFAADDIPLMVEAIPAKTGELVLVISKVEYPEELDTRFSRFTEPGEDYESENDNPEDFLSRQGATDILNMFRDENSREEADRESDGQKQEEKKQEGIRADADIICVFEFDHMEKVEHLSAMLRDIYHGQNDLYKFEKGSSGYYLLMHKNDHTPEQFNKICNISSEYGRQKPYMPAMKAYFEEHSSLIRAHDALQILAAVIG